MIWLLLFFVAWPGVNARRVKKIAQGEPVPTVKTFQTYFFTALTKSLFCTTDQLDHESLNRCQLETHRCGGSLIHPQFVLTAAHCLMYYEVTVKDLGDYKEWRLLPDRLDLEFYNNFTGSKEDYAWLYVKRGLQILYKYRTRLSRAPLHVTYSNFVLFAGGVAYQGDKSSIFKQKRHVIAVFPHEKVPLFDVHDESQVSDFRNIAHTIHDIAVLRTCLPFDIIKGQVELAPFDRSKAALKERYARVISNGLVCLYIGFGYSSLYQDNPRVDSNQMLFTWRSSVCYSQCNRPRNSNKFHNCVLCSKHHGPKLGALSEGDAGGPVICESRYTGVILRSDHVVGRNFTRGSAYPVHCAYDYITNDKLELYKKLPHTAYHPIRQRRLTVLDRD